MIYVNMTLCMMCVDEKCEYDMMCVMCDVIYEMCDVTWYDSEATKTDWPICGAIVIAVGPSVS